MTAPTVEPHEARPRRTRRRKPGATYGSDAHRARISAGLQRFHALRQSRLRVVPGDLVALRESGTLRPELLPFLDDAVVEAETFLSELGGVERLSAQRRALVADAVRLGALGRLLAARCLQRGGDEDSATRCATLLSARARLLALAGLDRVEREADTLDSFLARRAAEQAARSDELEGVTEAEVVDHGGRGSCAIGDAQPGRGVDQDRDEVAS